MSQVAFFRKFLFEAEVEMSLRLLSFSAGWSHPISPESGMCVSLPEVDSWIQGALVLCRNRSWKSLDSLLRFMQSEGLNPSRSSAAILVRVEIEDSLMREKVVWKKGQIQFSKTFQIQGRLQKKLRVLDVEITSSQLFLEPEEMFQFEAETPEAALEVLRTLFRLQTSEQLVLRDPLNHVAWS